MAADTLYVWITQQHTPLEKKRFDELAATMPEIIQQELFAYKRWQDAQASLTGKLLLKQALQELRIPFALSDIQNRHKDRPFIDASFDFNISHSGDYIIVALAFKNKIGVDIEKHRQLDIELFRKYFSEAEWEQIITAENPLSQFFTYWTIKESAIKCDGRGVEVLGKTKTQDDKTILCDDQLFHYQSLHIQDHYSCAVCSENEIDKIERKEIPMDSLFDFS